MEEQQEQIQTKNNKPHGCLTAALLALILGMAFCGGWVWLMSLMPDPTVRNGIIQGVIGGIYGIGLLVPFGAAAIFLRTKGYELWRGISLALALAGGYTLLSGGVLVAEIMLPWPGIPDLVLPLVTLFYGGILFILFHRYLSLTIRPATLILAAVLGMFVTPGWAVVGALGTFGEVLLAVFEAFTLALLVVIIVASIFYYDREMLASQPFIVVLVTGVAFLALTRGFLAVRGYWLQNARIALTLIPVGFTTGTLLVLNRDKDRPDWMAAFSFMFVILLVSFGWTEGLEGDWMTDDLMQPWLYAGYGNLVLSSVALLAGILLLLMRDELAERNHYLLIGSSLVGVLMMGGFAGTYLLIGEPGIQPEVFFVVMADQADTTFAQDIKDRDERVQTVYDTLTAHALEDQADIRAELDAQGINYTPYYLINGIEVEGSLLLRRQLEEREDVAYILNSPHARPLPEIVRVESVDGTGAGLPNAPYSWGVEEIGANQVWEEFDVTGEGIVVGIADSGEAWQHPALIESYRGNDGDHEYNWFDPWYGTTEPTDTGDHGTHTTGTVAGGYGIGVAPGAQWIGCRNLGRNLGNPAYYLDCMQFLFAPHPMDGDPFTDGKPSLGAHVTNNSWGCPPEEGCDGKTLAIAVDNLRNAGQMFVVSNGNEGPECSTVWEPASADAAFSVGASSQGGLVTGFSSRGPVLADGSGRVKPDVIAPGDDINSSIPEGYAEYPGTSMAGPHVVGLVALLWSANPDLIGDIDATEQIITGTAHYRQAANLCAGDTGEVNNEYGYGVIDAYEAVKRALER